MIFNPFRILIFNPFIIQTARILPKNPFRTSVFPKGSIFNPKALFLSKIHSEYQFLSKSHFLPKGPFSTPQIPFVNFPLSPIFNPDTSFLRKNPFRTSIFHKGPTFDPTSLSDPTFPSCDQHANFSPKSLILNTSAPFLPDNLLRTSIFP